MSFGLAREGPLPSPPGPAGGRPSTGSLLYSHTRSTELNCRRRPHVRSVGVRARKCGHLPVFFTSAVDLHCFLSWIPA